MHDKLLQIVGKGEYKLTDNYIYHVRSECSDKEIFIVTSQRVMYIVQSYFTGSYKVFFFPCNFNIMKNIIVYLKLLFKLLDSMGICMVRYDQTSNNNIKRNITSWKV